MFALNWLTGFRGEDLNNLANMAWMALKWSIFKIVSGDPDLHPRWPPLADIVLTWDRMGKKCFKIFSSETNQPI
jgi:hypothetical protein